MQIAFLVISFAVLALATYTDIKYGKVFWWSTLPVIAFGLIAQLFRLGAVDYILRLAIIVGIYFVYEGFIGGGDAKLVMMVTILQGVLCGLLTLGIASLFVLVISYLRNPDETVTHVKLGLTNLMTRQPNASKEMGPKALLAPYMLVAFALLTLVFGLY